MLSYKQTLAALDALSNQLKGTSISTSINPRLKYLCSAHLSDFSDVYPPHISVTSDECDSYCDDNSPTEDITVEDEGENEEVEERSNKKHRLAASRSPYNSRDDLLSLFGTAQSKYLDKKSAVDRDFILAIRALTSTSSGTSSSTSASSGSSSNSGSSGGSSNSNNSSNSGGGSSSSGKAKGKPGPDSSTKPILKPLLSESTATADDSRVTTPLPLPSPTASVSSSFSNLPRTRALAPTSTSTFTADSAEVEASLVMSNLATRHPVLWLRLIPAIARELKISAHLTTNAMHLPLPASTTSSNIGANSGSARSGSIDISGARAGANVGSVSSMATTATANANANASTGGRTSVTSASTSASAVAPAPVPVTATASGIDRDRNPDRTWSVTFYSREALRPLLHEQLWRTVHRCLVEIPSYLLGYALSEELPVAGKMLQKDVMQFMTKTASKRLVSDYCGFYK
jgi:hypothetical protein